MRSVLTAIGCLILTAGCATADAPRFGMQGHSMQGGGERHRRTVEVMREAGVEIMRDECHWSFVETEPGELTVPATWLESLGVNEELGMETLLILNYSSDHYDDGMAPRSDGGRAAFARYCEAIARETIDRVKYFEIWNEPNSSGFWPPEPNPENYAALVEVASEAIRAINPDAVIIAGSTSGIDDEFFQRAFAAGMAEHCDAISIHPYCTPESPEGAQIFERMEAIRDVSAEYGDPLDVWVTEFGYPTRGANCVSEDRQANMIARTYLLALTKPWMASTFPYWFGPDQADDEYHEHNFGLVRHNWDRKPSFAALQTITDLFAEAEFVESLDVADGIEAHVFSIPPSGEFTHLTALWAHEGIRHTEISADGNVQVVFRGGDQITMAPSSRTEAVTFDLVGAPVYLLTSGISDVREVSDPLITFTSPLQEIPVSEYLFALEDLHGSNFIGDVGMMGLDAMWGIDHSLEPFAGGVGTKPDRRNFFLSASVFDSFGRDRLPFARLVTEIHVVDSARVEITPLLGDDARAELVIHNQTAIAINGELTLESDAIISPTSVSIDALEEHGTITQEITFESPYDPDTNHTITGSVRLDNGEEVEFEEHFSSMTSPRAHEPITLDGDLSDWPEWDAIHLGAREQITSEFEPWGGPEDASALVYTAWDDTHFYFAAEVTDQVLAEAVSGHEMYKNDSFEIYIDADHEGDRHSEGYSDDDSEFGIGPVRGEDIVWAYKVINDVSPTSRAVINREPSSDHTVSSDECAWIVEAAFPLEEINLAPHHGKLIGFNVALNDDDDPRRVHPFGQDVQLMWNGRAQCWLYPRNFSDLFLVDPAVTENQ